MRSSITLTITLLTLCLSGTAACTLLSSTPEANNIADDIMVDTAAGGTPMGGTTGGAPMGGDPMGGDPMGGDPMGGDPMGGEPLGGMTGGDPMGGAMGGEPMGGAIMMNERFVCDDPDLCVHVLDGPETGTTIGSRPPLAVTHFDRFLFVVTEVAPPTNMGYEVNVNVISLETDQSISSGNLLLEDKGPGKLEIAVSGKGMRGPITVIVRSGNNVGVMTFDEDPVNNMRVLKDIGRPHFTHSMPVEAGIYSIQGFSAAGTSTEISSIFLLMVCDTTTSTMGCTNTEFYRLLFRTNSIGPCVVAEHGPIDAQPPAMDLDDTTRCLSIDMGVLPLADADVNGTTSIEMLPPERMVRGTIEFNTTQDALIIPGITSAISPNSSLNQLDQFPARDPIPTPTQGDFAVFNSRLFLYNDTTLVISRLGFEDPLLPPQSMLPMWTIGNMFEQRLILKVIPIGHMDGSEDPFLIAVTQTGFIGMVEPTLMDDPADAPEVNQWGDGDLWNATPDSVIYGLRYTSMSGEDRLKILVDDELFTFTYIQP